MSSPFKEEIEKLIQQNDLILDLTSLSTIKNETLDFILDNVKKITNIGKIKWNKTALNESFKPKIDKIEKQLIKNNEQFTCYPSDFIHCLMSYHVYTDTAKQNKILTLSPKESQLSIITLHDFTWSRLGENSWFIHEIFEEKEYKSILYINHKSKQIVLSFQGIKLKIADFFTIENNKIESFVYLLLQNKDISHQTIYSYLHAKRAVDLSNQKKYSLSFTGYSFGAWLAEQCVFFCHKDFNKRDVRAVTFESPGSYEYIDKLRTSCIVNDEIKIDLNDLDIITYLNEPNFVNTCNKHLGKVYRLYADNRSSITNQFIHEQIDQIEIEQIKKALLKSFKPSSDKNAYFLKGIKSLLPDGLEQILESFEYSKNNKLKKIINWPRTEFKSSEEFREHFKNLFDADQVLQLIPFIQSVPDVIKKLATCFTNLTLKQNVEIVNDHLNSLSIVFTLVTEIISGNFNNDKFLELFQLDDLEESTGNTENLVNKHNFIVNFDSQYKLQEVNFNKEILLPNSYGSVDYYLEKFSKINEFTSLQDEFIIKQLNHLRAEFTIEPDDFNLYIHSKKIHVEVIKERFTRLLHLETELKAFLENYFNQEKLPELGKLQNYFKESKLKYFIGRDRERKFLREKFLTKQYVCVYGKSGCGKSTLARQFAYERSEKDKNLTVRWIEAACHQNIHIDFKRIAHELNINNKEQGVINSVKMKLSSQPKHEKYLFILDNVTNEDDLNELSEGFSKNVDFIITTRNELIEINDEFNYEKLFIKNFNRDEGMLFIHKTMRVKITNKLSDDEWKKILDMIESSKNVSISPMKLSKLMSVVNEHISWSLDDIKAHLNREKENKFYLMQSECTKALHIFSYLAFLDGTSISLEFIRTIFIEISTDEIAHALNYLVKYSFLIPNETGFKIHESTQIDILTSWKYSDLNRNEILNKIVLALNNLFIYKHIDDSKLNISKKTELLFKQVNRVLKLDWNSKFKNINCADLFRKLAKTNKELLFDYKASLNNYLDELKVKKVLYNSTNTSVALCLNNIAVAYYCLDDYNKALEYYKETFKIYKDSSNYSPVNISNCLHNIAVVYRHLNQHELAIETYEASLKLKRENLPSNHTSLAMTLNNIALVYENVDFLERALKHYQECLKIFKETLPANHLSIASLLTSISNVYRKMGNYEEALEAQLEGLKIKKEEQPLNTSALAMTYNNIGLIYCYLENYDESLESYNECLRLFIDTLPSNYSSIASTINNIANVYSDAGEFRKALENYKESLRIKKETLPANHSSIATTLNNIGLIYDNLGDFEKALENYTECLTIFIETLPAHHSSIVSTIMSIGNVHYRLGNYAKALESYSECLKIKKQTMSMDTVSIGTTINSIGFVYDKLGDHVKALEYFEESLNIYEKGLPPNHPTLASALKNIEATKRKINKAK